MSDFSRLRRAAAVSVREAAARLGVSKSTAYRWENGEAGVPADVLCALERIAGAPDPRPERFRFIDMFSERAAGVRRPMAVK